MPPPALATTFPEAPLNLYETNDSGATPFVLLATTAFNTPAAGDFAETTLNYTSAVTDPSENLVVVIYANNYVSGTHADFADVQLSYSPTVPEPSTWAMMFLGFGVLAVAMRARRAKV